jgi:hypothetical protein
MEEDEDEDGDTMEDDDDDDDDDLVVILGAPAPAFLFTRTHASLAFGKRSVPAATRRITWSSSREQPSVLAVPAMVKKCRLEPL